MLANITSVFQLALDFFSAEDEKNWLDLVLTVVSIGLFLFCGQSEKTEE